MKKQGIEDGSDADVIIDPKDGRMDISVSLDKKTLRCIGEQVAAEALLLTPTSFPGFGKIGEPRVC